MVAGLGCCVAMSMPQVHVVAYANDLGYGAAHGARMLSMMLGFGVVESARFRLIADRIGGVRTLLLGSALQCLTLALYLPSTASSPVRRRRAVRPVPGGHRAELRHHRA